MRRRRMARMAGAIFGWREKIGATVHAVPGITQGNI